MRRFFQDLPEETLEEILLRLPPKLLKVCKCVCKLWHAMINNPSFIKKQLLVSIENNKHASPVTLCFGCFYRELSANEVLTWRCDNARGKQVLSLVTIHKDDGVAGRLLPCAIEEINLPPIPKDVEDRFPGFFAGTQCNGIICYYGPSPLDIDTVVFCNIELGEFKLLRTPHLRSDGFIYSGSGFGYDPKADDYKYVKFFAKVGPDKKSRAQVYTLGTDSWREVDLKGIFCWLLSGVYCRGFCYWWNAGVQGSECTVLSLDISEEQFDCIQLPTTSARQPNREFKRLTMWNESVVFFISTERSFPSTSYEMWIMVRNLNDVEWNKHLTIGPLACIHSPLAFWKDDELLMQTRVGGIISYNLHTRKLMELPLPGSVLPSRTHAFSCVRSLVSLKRENLFNR